MSSGQVALYTLALLSSCHDPRHVESQGHSVNLLQVLEQKTHKEVARLGTGAEGGTGRRRDSAPHRTPSLRGLTAPHCLQRSMVSR